MHLYTHYYFSGVIASSSGPGSGPVHLGAVHCSGLEDSLVNCRRSRFGELHDYYCLEDASVYCPRKYHLAESA